VGIASYIALVQFDGGGHNYIGPEDDLDTLIAAAKADFAEDMSITAIYVEDCVDSMPHNTGANPYWMATR